MKRCLSCLLLVFALLIAACAPVGAYHTFYFEPADNKNVKVLDWKYGDYWANRRAVKIAESGGQGLSQHVASLKPVGDYFYIKWIVPPSSEIHEVNVDLRPLFPWNMARAEVRPSFGEDNEFVIYLAIPSGDAPHVQTFRRRSYLQSFLYQIYPVKTKIEPTGEGVRQ